MAYLCDTKSLVLHLIANELGNVYWWIDASLFYSTFVQEGLESRGSYVSVNLFYLHKNYEPEDTRNRRM